MRVLYVVNSSSFFCSHFLTLAKSIHDNGHAVYVIAGDAIKRNEIENMGFSFICIPLSRSGINPLREILFIINLRSRIINISPDIIHTFTVKPILYTGLIVSTLRKKERPKVCNSITGLGSAYLSKKISGRMIWSLIKILYKTVFLSPNASAVFENEDDRDFFVELGLVNSSQTYIVNGAGIDTESFLPSEIKTDRVTVVLVARLLKDKGIAEYIDAGKILHEKKINVSLLLVGDVDADNISSMSKTDIKDAHDAGYIEWLGHRTDVVDIYRKAHIACLPSYREGLPKSLIEAASCGLPIITTNVPGCRQMVHDGTNGMLIEAKSATAIADAIIFLVLNPSVMKDMAISSRAIAVNKFDHQHIVGAFHNIYKFHCHE